MPSCGTPIARINRSGSLLTPTSPLRFADVFNEPAGRAPLLGTHTDEVLEEVLGLAPTEVGRLHDDGLVASAAEDGE